MIDAAAGYAEGEAIRSIQRIRQVPIGVGFKNSYGVSPGQDEMYMGLSVLPSNTAMRPVRGQSLNESTQMTKAGPLQQWNKLEFDEI